MDKKAIGLSRVQPFVIYTQPTLLRYLILFDAASINNTGYKQVG